MSESREANAKLSAGQARRLPFGSSPKLAARKAGLEQQAPGRRTPGSMLAVALKAILALVGFSALIAFASWLILVLTVVATPIVSNSTIAVTQRATWVIGEAPVGDRALALSSPMGYSTWDRFTEAFSGYPGASVIDIVAVPGDKVSTTFDGQLIINGKKTKTTLTDNVLSHTLGNAYLGVCVEGACAAGGPVEVPADQLLGKVLNMVELPAQIQALLGGADE